MLSIPAVLRSAERGIFGDAWAFTRAAGGGFVDAGVNTVKGLGSLAKGGYKLVTDSQTREKAWDTANEVAGRAKDYGSKVVDDPGKPFRDARDGATSMSNAFKEAREKAASEGRSAEFWGDLTGSGAFEVGSMLIPVGAASKLGKAGKIADAGADTAKALDKAADLGKASKTAKGFPDGPPCAVSKCPNAALPAKRTVVDLRTITADEANAPFVSKGWSPPYAAGTKVRKFTVAQPTKFVRVHTAGNPTGAFLVRADEIAGMTSAEIKQHLALPSLPTHIRQVTVPAGTPMQVGKVGAQPGFGVPNDGGFQYQLLGRVPESAFGPSVPLQ